MKPRMTRRGYVANRLETVEGSISYRAGRSKTRLSFTTRLALRQVHVVALVSGIVADSCVAAQHD